MNERKSFSINPGTAMIDVLGHSGYTFDFAIADLIDNMFMKKVSMKNTL